MESAFLIFALLGFLGGGAALLVGLRGHRVGAEPFCRRCNYNLTKLRSPQCPECGLTLAPGNVLVGVHHRRPYAIFLGICTLLVAAVRTAALPPGLATRIAVSRPPPLNGLISRANPSASRPFAELNRRVKLPTLATADAQRIAAAAI